MTDEAMRRRSGWPLLLALVAVFGLVALVVVIAREGPDRTVTGTITELQSHRVCIADGNGPEVCVRANSPERLASVARGECVRARYSAEDILISLDRVADGC